MSRKRQGKKLQPAKKAWKSFSNTVQHKLHKLNIPKSMKTTLQRLLQSLHSLGHVIHSRLHRSFTTIRPRGGTATSNYYHVQYKHCAAIHIDDLFDNKTNNNSAVSVQATNKTSAPHATQVQGETSIGKEIKGKEKVEHGIYKGNNLVGQCRNQSRGGGESSSSGLNTIEDAWKVVVAKSPQLHVDQKAEEFISKFREDMRLQKKRSMLEFQEMLARST